LRRDAFQVLLAVQPSQRQRARLAIEALRSPDLQRRKLALACLTDNQQQLAVFRDKIFSYVDIGTTSGWTDGTPIIPEPPAGLEVAHVRPLRDDPDPLVAAQAGYLLALLGQRDGLDPLLSYWRSRDRNDPVRRLVYRAIAVLDDSSRLADLNEIADSLVDYELREFYWTVRIMSGPEILQFRKKLREDPRMSKSSGSYSPR
jgi:hypothetical protein